jgi:hypothetical protein
MEDLGIWDSDVPEAGLVVGGEREAAAGRPGTTEGWKVHRVRGKGSLVL